MSSSIIVVINYKANRKILAVFAAALHSYFGGCPSQYGQSARERQKCKYSQRKRIVVVSLATVPNSISCTAGSLHNFLPCWHKVALGPLNSL
jgi:hypothetical protein